MQGRTSKATYLHGSFGSGKSHFMAVLHLILQGNPAARAIPELACGDPEAQRLAGRQEVPAGALPHDQRPRHGVGHPGRLRGLHPPQAPRRADPAGLHVGGDHQPGRGRAGQLRRRGVLQAAQRRPGGGGEGGWGELEAAWDAASFEAAAAAPPDSETHLRLVSTLLKTVATSHAEVISHRGGNFVRFDKGLSIISQHAAGLGYDALILFLDELILWLAMNSADLGFVNREAAKLTNLVEAQTVGPARADRQLRGPAAGPAGADRRARARGRAAELRRLAGLPAGAVRHDHPGGPQPAGHRREAGAAVQERGGRGRNWTRPSSRRPG